MAARKDDSQKQPGGDRRAVIWRLPSTHGGDDSASGEGASPPGRRVPLPVVWGLAAALVLLGLYAAWSEFGGDIRGTGGEPDTAALPVETTAVDQPAGDGAPPSMGDDPAAASADREEESEADPAPDSAPSVTVQEGIEPAPSAEQAPAASVVDPPSPSPAVADAAPETISSPESAQGGEMKPTAGASVATGTGTVEGGDDIAQATPDAFAPSALAARLSALEAQAAAATGTGAAVAALAQRVSALEDDSARLELDRALALWGEQRAALETALAEVSARLAQVEAEAVQQATADGRVMTLVLATGELTGALGSSAGVAPALETVRRIAGDDHEIAAALERLAPFAATGVATLDGLRARFPQAANAIARTAPAGGDADWIDETVTRLSQLVTVRRTGGAIDPESLDGRLVEAETALAAGDLARAIALVEPLAADTAAATSAQEWLLDARARREAEDALAQLAAAVRARIGARWAATGASP